MYDNYWWEFYHYKKLEQNSWIIFPIGMLTFCSNSAQIPVTTILLWVMEVCGITQLLTKRYDQGVFEQTS